MKSLILTFIGTTALMITAPLAAQEPDDADATVMADGADDATDPMAGIMAMMSGLFAVEELTPEQEARLPAASAVVSMMLPEGFYAEMMGEMMDGIMGPMMGMFEGETGASLVLGARLDADPEVIEALSAEQKVELATILDPAYARRGAVMQGMMGGVMTEVATAIEPAFREGLSRAYAVRFDAAQIADIAAFFETPTGAVYATEQMKLMADPQVMSAGMQAVPAMMSQFGNMEARIREEMAALPPENAYEDLSAAQRARLSELTGIAPNALPEAVRAPRDPDAPPPVYDDEYYEGAPDGETPLDDGAEPALEEASA